MPSIPPDLRHALLGPCGCCRSCKQELLRHYCRTCDQFFFTCCCFQTIQNIHLQNHRVYFWTATDILAIPDFDNFPMDGIDITSQKS